MTKADLLPSQDAGENNKNQEAASDEIAQFVQPRYRQDRSVVLGKLAAQKAGKGPYPQLVDPSIIKPGDVLTLVRAIEPLPTRELTVAGTKLGAMDNGDPEAIVEVSSSKFLVEDREDELGIEFPHEFMATTLGFAKLNPRGEDSEDEYFPTLHVHLTDTQTAS